MNGVLLGRYIRLGNLGLGRHTALGSQGIAAQYNGQPWSDEIISSRCIRGQNERCLFNEGKNTEPLSQRTTQSQRWLSGSALFPL